MKPNNEHDNNKERYFFPAVEFDWREQEKIRSEINTNYSKYENDRFCVHLSYGLDGNAYAYYFENHGFDEYNIYVRAYLE